MKSFCTRVVLFFCLALLVAGAAACTQSRPAVPTPTLVPLDNPNLLPTAEGLPTAIIIEGQPTAAGGEPTLVPPPVGGETPVPADGQPTPIVVEPTLFPTPTTVGDVAQPVATTEPGATTSPEQPTSGTCSNPYTVLAGEWFYSIARKCGVTPQALLAANPRVNPSFLRPGQIISMPGGSAPDSGSGAGAGAPPPTADTSGQQAPPSGGCSDPYVVQRGDTLNSIARKCGTTAAALQQANRIPAPDYIFPGQKIRIP